ncbi:MAG: hypothetical protein IPJ34_31925 [Myxococcales bacterium]|nr:hypothetical protein [Myxococcales bacterium]
MRLLPLLFATSLLACSSETDPGTVSDTGPRDTGTAADTGTAVDTSVTDTGASVDSTATDTGSTTDTGKADTGKTDTGLDTGTPPVEGGECGSDGDCRAYESYCSTMDPCTCIPLPIGVADPKCGGATVTCFVAPCSGKKAACVGGTCAIVAK